MTKEYLKGRIELLEREIEQIEELSEMSKVSIKQIDAQIHNLQNEIDESSKLLSVSVRNNMTKKKEEVVQMKDNKESTFGQIDKYSKEVAEKTKEINLIKECLKELETKNVSRETFSANEQKTVNDMEIRKESGAQDLKNKLNFCKNLCGIDDIRVRMELEEIIKSL